MADDSQKPLTYNTTHCTKMGDNILACCPWDRKCQKLRIVVVTTKPWTVVPGTSTSQQPIDLSLPPNVVTSTGIPDPVRLSGSNGAYLGLVADLPYDLVQAYSPNTCLTVLAYDFGKLPCCTGKSVGSIVARGKGNCTQATLSFSYRWCGQTPCEDDVSDRFQPLDCTYNGLAFQVLNTASWISDNNCLDSIVVLGLEQYCPLAGGTSIDTGCRYQAFPCGAKPRLPVL